MTQLACLISPSPILTGVITGMLVSVVATISAILIFEPLREFRKKKEDISWWFAYSETGLSDKVEKSTRLAELAANLHATARAVPCYGLFSRMGIVPAQSAVDEAVRLLVGAAYDLTLRDGTVASANMKKVSVILSLPPPIKLPPLYEDGTAH